MKLREYKAGDLEKIQEAIKKLREARELLKSAGAAKSATRVRRALKSAEGAERHADGVMTLRRKTKAVIAAEEQFNLLVRVAACALGGTCVTHVNGDAATLTFETTVGPLHITPLGNWIACRFEDVEQAKSSKNMWQVMLNPSSGKWNWHFSGYALAPGMTEVLQFAAALRTLLPKVES
jgi:hypothetical protein